VRSVGYGDTGREQRGEAMPRVTVRMSTETRKQHIVQAALEAIGEFGIQGATISRIAKRTGITPAALYSHFENRRAILVAALDVVYEQITDSFRSSSSDDPIEQVRQICESHMRKVLSQDKTSHAHLFLEFVASAPEESLREVLRTKELETTSYLASIVKGFQEQGRLSPDIDAEMVAWLIAGWAWTGDVANLMDATSIWHRKVSSHLMDSILAVLSPGSRAPHDTDYDGLPDGAVFTTEEAAAILKVSTDTVSGMVDRKQIRSLTLGNETRISRRTLVAFLRGMSDEEFDSLPARCAD
jgi:excisionase family DNA binding protein